jgi:hypothetical protein
MDRKQYFLLAENAKPEPLSSKRKAAEIAKKIQKTKSSLPLLQIFSQRFLRLFLVNSAVKAFCWSLTAILELFPPFPGFMPVLSAISDSPPQNACPKPVLGDFLKKEPSRLLKVKSRGHVYPLSCFPYF